MKTLLLVRYLGNGGETDMNSRKALIVAWTAILLTGLAGTGIEGQIVRRVGGVPEGHYVWGLSHAGTDIYAVDLYGNRYDLRYRPIPRRAQAV